MNLNRCPKCGSDSMYRDSDNWNRYLIVACFICGWRYYEYAGDVFHYDFGKKVLATCRHCGKAYTRAEGAKGGYCYECRRLLNARKQREYILRRREADRGV